MTTRMIVDRKPRDLGYSMPAEWHPHRATWLAWPKNRETWGGRLPRVETIYLQMIAALTSGEEVRLLVDDPNARRRIEDRFSHINLGPAAVRFFEIPTVDAWIRDYGPNFLIRETGLSEPLAWNEWGFNAWGKKYDDLEQDATVPRKLSKHLDLPFFTPGMILEGGAIDVNGRGSCLTTEDCVLNPNRNPGLDRGQIETRLMEHLGVDEIIWLRGGIDGDDTDGHIDNIARFVRPDTIVCAVSGDSNSALDENFRRLRGMSDKGGRQFRVIPLPVPDPVTSAHGILPASYMNFYIANKVILAPVFHQEKDDIVLDLLGQLFPDREVIGIYCEPLIHGFGAIHCLTQQQPAERVDAGQGSVG